MNPVRIPDGLPSIDEIDNFRLLSSGELIDLRKQTPEHVELIPKPDSPKAIGIKMGEVTQGIIEYLSIKNKHNFRCTNNGSRSQITEKCDEFKS